MSRKLLLGGLILLVLSGCFAGRGSAKNLRVGLETEANFPFYFKQGGELQGAEIEITRLVARQLGHQLEFKRYPCENLGRQLAAGEIDVMLSGAAAAKNFSRDLRSDSPYVYQNIQLIVPRGSDIAYEGQLQQPEKYSFGKVNGTVDLPIFSGDKEVEVRAISSARQLLKLLVAGELDAGVGPRSLFLSRLEEKSLLREVTFLEPPLTREPRYLVVSPQRSGATSLAANFSNQLAEVRSSDTYAKLLDKYRLRPGSQKVNRGKLTISTGNYVPWTGEDMEFGGPYLRVIRAVFERAGFDVKFEFYPWKRALAQALNEEVQASAYWAASRRRRKRFYQSKPLAKDRVVFFYRRDNPLKGWQSFEALADYKIGVTRGYTYTDEFWHQVKKGLLDIDRANKDLNNFKKLVHGRIGLFPCEKRRGYYLLREKLSPAKAAQISHCTKPLTVTTCHLLFTKSDPDSRRLRRIFNKQLKRLKQETEYSKYWEDTSLE